MSASSALLALPYELRQRILRFALKQRGSVELQRPLWAGHEEFVQPLFMTNKQIRIEALEAFYKVNAFTWGINTCDQIRSNPAQYPLSDNRFGDASILPAIPWHYPYIHQHLRHIYLSIYLPSLGMEAAQCAGYTAILSEMVAALDKGKRLRNMSISFVTVRSYTWASLSMSSMLGMLKILTEMEIPGRISINTRNLIGDAKEGVLALDLESNMAAKRVS